MQQWEILREEGKQDADPRNQCLTDLTNYIKATIAKWKSTATETKRAIILAWDANGTTDSYQLENFMTDTGLVEVYDLKLGGKHNAPPTYSRGTTKIDHIMITPNISEHIRTIGMTGYGTNINADHRALFIDIDINTFLHGKPEYLTPPQHRQVTTKDPRIVVEYITEVAKYLDDHNYTARIEKVIAMDNNSELATVEIEKIDRDMTRARMQASKKLGRRYKAGWSPKLQNAYLTQQYWVTRIAKLRKPRTNYNPELQRMGINIEEKEKEEYYTHRQLKKKLEMLPTNSEFA